jgi:predicted nucleotidyltransferase
MANICELYNVNFKLSEDQGRYLLAGQVGSQAYGTATEDSDMDFLSVFIKPNCYYTGLEDSQDSYVSDKKETINAEATIFELKKFLKLCLKFNPNVIPLLYLRENEYVIRSSEGVRIIKNRQAFESQQAYNTFIGYALDQRNAIVNCVTGKLGTKRKLLVDKFGYDVKYAMHTIRILRMATEFFLSGKMNIFRPDSDELLFIRNGGLTLKSWINLVDEELMQARKAADLEMLPEKPDFDCINDLCQSIITEQVTGN